jgi:hypothetical protein
MLLLFLEKPVIFVEHSGYFLLPSLLLILNTIVMSLFVIQFLHGRKLTTCLFLNLFTPFLKAFTTGHLLSVLSPLFELQGTQTCNPIMACLMNQERQVIFCSDPSFWAYTHSWEDLILPSLFSQKHRVVVDPICIGKKPCVCRRATWEVFP